MKVVINGCWGGFSISQQAAEYMAAHGHQEAIEKLADFAESGYWFGSICRADEQRSDPLLVDAVETLGRAANGRFAELYIVEVPDDVEWYIHDYDGQESVHEKHRSWD